MKKNGKFILLILLVFVLILSMGLWYGSARSRNSATTATEMRTVVERGNLDVVISGTGTIEAEVRKEVRAALGGTVARFDIDEGAIVEAGQVLVEMDVQNIASQIETKRLDIEIQERELQKLISEQTYAVIRTAVNGEVNWHLKNGDRVQAGSALGSVTNQELMEIRGQFDATQVSAVKKGQTATFYLPDYSQEFSGQVTDISTVRRAGKSQPVAMAYYEIKAEFTNPENLPDGALGRMTIVTPTGNKQAIQRAALFATEPLNVRASIAGTLTQRVKSGVSVAVGQWLGELSDSQRKDQLNNQITAANVRLHQAYIDLSDLERQQADADGNDLALASRIQKLWLDITNQEAEINRLKSDETYTTVVAPAKGELQWHSKEGDRVQEGQLIASVQNRSMLETVGRFTAEEIGNIAQGQRVDLYLAEYGITIQGKVTEVGSVPKAVNAPQSLEALYEVTVAIKNPGNLDANTAGLLSVKTLSGNVRTVQAATAAPDPLLLRAPISGTVTIQVENGQAATVDRALGEISDPDRASQLQHQIATAELRLRQSRLDLADKVEQQSEHDRKAVLRAPISGMLLLPPQPSDLGEDVPQGTLLATVVDYSKVQVVIPVDELDLSRVTPGMAVRITVAALPETTFEGRVLTVAQEGKAQGGVSVFDVTVVFANVGGLRAGMTANVDILVESLQDVLLVPIEAIITNDGQSLVMVADENKVKPRMLEVVTGANDTSRIQIISGLSAGQQVLIPESGVTSGLGGFSRGGGFPAGGGGINR